MINEMAVLVKTEHLDDNDKKEYCEMQFDHADDKEKSRERAHGKLTAGIEDAKETIATLKDESMVGVWHRMWSEWCHLPAADGQEWRQGSWRQQCWCSDFRCGDHGSCMEVMIKM